MKRKQATPPATAIASNMAGPDDKPTKRQPSPVHRFGFRLRNGFVGQLRLSAKVIDRLWYKVQHPGDSHHFIVFDGEQRRFALNIRHVLATQFDAAKQGGLEGELVKEGGDFSVFYLADSPTPLRLRIAPDPPKEKPATNDGPHVAEFFGFLEMTYRGLDIAQHLRIADGSTLWLRLEDISFVSVPLRLFADGSEQNGQVGEGDDGHD